MSNIKFLLDEDISAKTLNRLRGSGFVAESVDTLKLKGTRNSSLLQLALKNQYILISHDQDFIKYKYPHHGILVVMIHPATDDVAGMELEKFLKAKNLDDLKNKVTILKKP